MSKCKWCGGPAVGGTTDLPPDPDDCRAGVCGRCWDELLDEALAPGTPGGEALRWLQDNGTFVELPPGDTGRDVLGQVLGERDN